MPKAIGPTFSNELVAAGVPLDGIAWGSDGAFCFRDDVPQAVRDQVAAVYAAHDPTKQLPPPPPTPREWLARLAPATQAAVFTAANAKAAAGDVSLQVWLAVAMGGPAIDVTDPMTAAGVQAFVAANALTADDEALLLAS